MKVLPILLTFLLLIFFKTLRAGAIKPFGVMEYYFNNANINTSTNVKQYSIKFCFSLENSLPLENYMKVILPTSPVLLSLDVKPNATWY